MEKFEKHDPGAIAPQRPRLEWPDWLLLLTLGPLFLVCFLLHVDSALFDTMVFYSYYASPAPTASDYPTVEGFILELENAGDLQIGDRILNIGGVDTQGASAFRVYELTLGQARSSMVPMEIERDGVQMEVIEPLARPESPWSRVPFLVGFASVALIVLLRSPGSGPTRLMFASFMNVAIFQSTFTGASPFQFYAGALMFVVWGVIAIVSAGVWVVMFPPRLDPRFRIRRGLALVPAAMWMLPRLTVYFGGPLPRNSVSEQMFIVDLIILAWLLGVLSWNYFHSELLGRRRVKWVLFGAFLGMSPLIVLSPYIASSPDGSLVRSLHSWAVGLVVLFPAGVLFAIARYNLFDIDRMISGTASYSMVLVLFAVAGEEVLEPIAGLMGERLGFDSSSSQLVFVAVMAGAVIPIQRAWRPFVDRVFFSAGRSLNEEIEHLLEELSETATNGTAALVNLVGVRLGAVFEPAFCIVYQRTGDGFAPTFSSGEVDAQPVSGESTSSITRTLGMRVGPMRLDARGRSGGNQTAADDIRTALAGLDPELLVPLRPHGALDAFMCIGHKLTGDVYTSTDLSLLATVAHHVSEELSASDTR